MWKRHCNVLFKIGVHWYEKCWKLFWLCYGDLVEAIKIEIKINCYYFLS